MGDKRPLYERAREAGVEAGERARKRTSYRPNGWEGAFLCFAAKEWPGLEAAYRQFAVGYDADNKRWAEGNND